MSITESIVALQDRTYVPKEKLQPVYEKGLALWLEHVLHDPAIKDHALEELLSCISRLQPHPALFCIRI